MRSTRLRAAHWNSTVILVFLCSICSTLILLQNWEYFPTDLWTFRYKIFVLRIRLDPKFGRFRTSTLLPMTAHASISGISSNRVDTVHYFSICIYPLCWFIAKLKQWRISIIVKGICGYCHQCKNLYVTFFWILRKRSMAAGNRFHFVLRKESESSQDIVRILFVGISSQIQVSLFRTIL